MQVTHLTAAELEAGSARGLVSPADVGTVDMIVRRPRVDEREILEQGELIVGEGLAGDNYVARGNERTPDGKAHPEAQLTLMSSRVVDLVAGGDRDRWALAGDQFFVDLDLSTTNLATGSQLRIGTALIEVAAKPHNGCQKFSARFGIDAVRWVNAEKGLRRRGLNAMVIEPGTVRTGDTIIKLA